VHIRETVLHRLKAPDGRSKLIPCLNVLDRHLDRPSDRPAHLGGSDDPAYRTERRDLTEGDCWRIAQLNEPSLHRCVEQPAGSHDNLTLTRRTSID
jgi:hypothetical protein